MPHIGVWYQILELSFELDRPGYGNVVKEDGLEDVFILFIDSAGLSQERFVIRE